MSHRLLLAALFAVSASGCYVSHVDCDDPSYAHSAACVVGPDPTTGRVCSPGESVTYTLDGVDFGSRSSGIEHGGSGPSIHMSCAPSPCYEDEVHVLLNGGIRACAAPPPVCPDGTFLNWADPDGWRCDAPCDVIVHYGYLFAGRSVCTSEPPPCDSGLVPTFDAPTETWVCRPACDNGEYDQVYLDSRLVCVPC